MIKACEKASGSYYTPEQIVEYINRNTVDKKCEEIHKKFIKINIDTINSIETVINTTEKSLFSKYMEDNIKSFISDEVLNLFSVLDPAMGSGHFIVNATNHISNFITEFINSFNIISDYETGTSDIGEDEL